MCSSMTEIAQEMLNAFPAGTVIPQPPSARDAGFDLAAAYGVESELVRARQAAGPQAMGLKVGYANKAVMRALKLETMVWAHMYDDTVRYADGDTAELALPFFRSPKIEPEIVFRTKEPVASGGLDAAAVLQHVDWLAI